MLNKVLLYNSGGGIGDALQIIPIIDTLKFKFKNTEFHYLCSHQNHFNTTLDLYLINLLYLHVLILNYQNQK